MKRIILTAILGWMALAGWAQNRYHLSQYMLYQPFVNPAAIASYDDLQAAMLYKNQWLGVEGAPVIYSLAGNMPLKGENNHVGLSMTSDRVGVHKNMNILAKYAYRIKTGTSNHLSFGLSAGVDMLQSNLAELTITDAQDPVFTGNTGTFTRPNFEFGTYFFAKEYYIGFAIPNLLNNQIRMADSYTAETSFEAANMHYFLHGGYEFALKNEHKLNVSTLVKNVAGAPMQVDLNAQVLFRQGIGIGASYRSGKIINGLVNFKINEMFRLGYAYDYNMTSLSQFSSGSHELVLLIHPVKEAGTPMIMSPRF